LGGLARECDGGLPDGHQTEHAPTLNYCQTAFTGTTSNDLIAQPAPDLNNVAFLAVHNGLLLSRIAQEQRLLRCLLRSAPVKCHLSGDERSDARN
jgi:hypothetical protein